MNEWAKVRSAITGFTSVLMVIVAITVSIRKSKEFELESTLFMAVALLPVAGFAFTKAERRQVLLYGTLHVVLMVGLTLLYLIGIADTFGFLVALPLYSAALAVSIAGICDR